jgi:hypothetical protein
VACTPDHGIDVPTALADSSTLTELGSKAWSTPASWKRWEHSDK